MNMFFFGLFKILMVKIIGYLQIAATIIVIIMEFPSSQMVKIKAVCRYCRYCTAYPHHNHDHHALIGIYIRCSFHHPKWSKSSQMLKIIPNGQNDGLVVDIAAATTICPKSPKSSGTLVLEMARMSFTWFSFCQISLLRGFFIKLARIVQIQYFG